MLSASPHPTEPIASPDPAGPLSEVAALVVSLFSTKGGVGKTTLAGNLGALVADLGRRVLIIDADPQQSASAFYPIVKRGSGGLLQLITRPEGFSPHDCVSTTEIEGLDIVLSNDPERHLASWIRRGGNRFQALRVAVDELRSRYDLILIDSQGSDGRGDLQELALRSADKILMPVPPDAVATREALTNSFRVLRELAPHDPRDTFNTIPAPHVMLVMVNRSSSSHTQYVRGIRARIEEMAQKGLAFEVRTEIPRSVVYNDAQSLKGRLPVHRFDPSPRDKRQRMPCAAQTMTELAHELLPEVMAGVSQWPDCFRARSTDRGVKGDAASTPDSSAGELA